MTSTSALRVEAAATTALAKLSGDKKGGSSSQWAKIKFDRQIVAIARVNNADTIYSTDRDVARFGQQSRIAVLNVGDLPEPPPKQIDIDYVEAGVASDETVTEAREAQSEEGAKGEEMSRFTLTDAVIEVFTADPRSTIHFSEVSKRINAKYPGKWEMPTPFLQQILNTLARGKFLDKPNGETGEFRKA